MLQSVHRVPTHQGKTQLGAVKMNCVCTWSIISPPHTCFDHTGDFNNDPDQKHQCQIIMTQL